MTSSPPPVGLADLFWTIARRLRHDARTTMAPWDVTPSQVRALRALESHAGALRPGELAGHLRIAARSATEVIDDLEARGLVERQRDPTDRRAVLVALTSTGTELLEEIRAARQAETERYFGRLSAEDRAELARILRILADVPPHGA